MCQHRHDAPRNRFSHFASQAGDEAELLLQHGFREVAAELYEAAVGFDLLCVHGVPTRTLFSLDIHLHFKRDWRGRLHRIVIAGSQTKRAVPIHIPLRQHVVERIDRHLEVFRPIILRGEPSNELFPGANDELICCGTLRTRMSLLISRLTL
jgi:hypothetical protein